MRILVTGFDPFGGESVNPAFEAVKLLPDTIAGAEIIKLEIPTVFSKCGPAVEAGIEKYNPDVVVNVGQAGGRSCVTIEKVAINLAEARIPDNAGEQPRDAAIQADGKNAYFSLLPVNAIVQNIRAHGLPCHVSYSAGTYVCNAVMYEVLYMIEKKYQNMRAGFIHVPFASEQVVDKPNGMASMSVKDIAKSIEYAIEATVNHKEDIVGDGGTTH